LLPPKALVQPSTAGNKQWRAADDVVEGQNNAKVQRCGQAEPHTTIQQELLVQVSGVTLSTRKTEKMDAKKDGAGASYQVRARAMAKTTHEITHAITLRGVELNRAILNCTKPVENRNFTIGPGWVALHNGAGVDTEAACIVGAARFAHAVPLELLTADLRPDLRAHCFGPLCNVVAEVQRLAHPIQRVKGKLSLWALSEEQQSAVRDGLRLGQSSATRFDLDHIPPPTHTEMVAWRTAEKNRRALKKAHNK